MKKTTVLQLNKKFWFFFCVAIAVEFFLFRHYTLTYISPYYPFQFDQTTYLKNTYALFEYLKNPVSFGEYWDATGILFQCLTVAIFFLGGASRFSALLLGFTFFVLMQFTLVLAAKKHFQSKWLMLFLWGSVIAAPALYAANAGSLFDFRMDFSALCLYGILVNLYVLSDRFTIKHVNYFVALTVFVMIGVRFITVAYLLSFLGLYLFGQFIYAWFGEKSLSIRQSFQKFYNKKIVKNSFHLLFLVVGLFFVYVCIFHENLYNYYVVGHLVGSEKSIRLAEQGVSGWLAYLVYYPINFYKMHLGAVQKNGIIILLLLFFIRLCFCKAQSKTLILSFKANAFLYAFFCFMFAPLLILTLDESKSPIVFSIITVPFWWFVTEVVDAFMPEERFSRVFSRTLLVVLVFICFFSFAEPVKLLLKQPSEDKLADLQAISRLYMKIGDEAIALHKTSVNISFNRIVDYLACDGITDLYYEKTSRWVSVNVTKLGGQIFSISKQDAIAALDYSDFVVFTTHCQKSEAYYFELPLTRSVEDMRPALDAKLKENFKLIETYKLSGCDLALFEKSAANSVPDPKKQ